MAANPLKTFLRHLFTLALVLYPLSALSQKTFLSEKSDEVLQHPVEQRGFVTVPLDYANPLSQNIRIFYRLIPADGVSASENSRPTLVVIHGGPGLPSSLYRSYDFDYSSKDKRDKLSPLTKWFRILIVDQRGTPGLSTALNMSPHFVDYNFISTFFSADSIAKDHEQVINTVLGENTSFFMIAQSFGGLVGFQYLTLAKIKHKPTGIIFSSPAMPFEDAHEATMSRRRTQKELNEQLKKAYPDIELKVTGLRRHFSKMGVNPENVNVLWNFLGRGKDGEWQKAFMSEMERLQTTDKVKLQEYISDSVGSPDLLNYILSSSNMTPGWTDTTLSKKAMEEMPFEPWMFDECKTFVLAAEGSSHEAKLRQQIDLKPPGAVPFPPQEEIKGTINKVPVLFTFGNNDAMTPTQPAIDHLLRNFYVPGTTQYKTIEGGHQAAFTPDGIQVIHEWVRRVLCGRKLPLPNPKWSLRSRASE